MKQVVAVSVPICPGVLVQDSHERLLEMKQKRRVGENAVDGQIGVVRIFS